MVTREKSVTWKLLALHKRHAYRGPHSLNSITAMRTDLTMNRVVETFRGTLEHLHNTIGHNQEPNWGIAY